MFDIVYPKGGGYPEPRFRRVSNGGVFKYFFPTDLQKYSEDMSKVVESDKSQYYQVVKSNDLIIGVSKMERNPYIEEKVYWISYVSVDPDFQGEKHASKLVEEIFRFAQQEGITIETSSYTKDGWEKVRHLIKKFSEQYKVTIIDKDRKNY